MVYYCNRDSGWKTIPLRGEYIVSSRGSYRVKTTLCNVLVQGRITLEHLISFSWAINLCDLSTAKPYLEM